MIERCPTCGHALSTPSSESREAIFRQILAALEEPSTIRELKQKLGLVSEPEDQALRYRLKQLESRGVITKTLEDVPETTSRRYRYFRRS